MFVPTHYKDRGYDSSGKREVPYVVIYTSGTWTDVFNLETMGYHAGISKSTMENFTLITLQCPYCSSTLNQSERIECECGFIGRAIDNEVLEFMYDKINISLHSANNPKDDWIEFVTREGSECFLVWKINGLNWLEIKAGKESE